jgi:hypothetical protein
MTTPHLCRHPGTRAALAALSIATAIACSGDVTEPEPALVLTSLDVRPTAATISVAQPLNTAELRAVAYDQHADPMAIMTALSFSSANESVATVDGGGTITAVATGQTMVTATLTIGGITKTATATVTVVPEREPALVGSWKGTAAGQRADNFPLQTSNMVLVLNGDLSFSAVGDAGWQQCLVEGGWELPGETFAASGHDTGCPGSQQLTFTAPLSNSQRLDGSWVASNGHNGTFSLGKQ